MESLQCFFDKSYGLNRNRKIAPSFKINFCKILNHLNCSTKKFILLAPQKLLHQKNCNTKKKHQTKLCDYNTSSIVRFREFYEEVDESNICKRLSMAEVKVLSQRNKPKFVHDGCTYIFHKLSEDKLRKFWRCDRRWEGCKARIHTGVSTDQVSSFSKILIQAKFSKKLRRSYQSLFLIKSIKYCPFHCNFCVEDF